MISLSGAAPGWRIRASTASTRRDAISSSRVSSAGTRPMACSRMNAYSRNSHSQSTQPATRRQPSAPTTRPTPSDVNSGTRPLAASRPPTTSTPAAIDNTPTSSGNMAIQNAAGAARHTRINTPDPSPPA